MDKRVEDFDRRMTAAVDVLAKELAGIRTGRATASLLDPIKVDAYGSLMPLSQVGNVSAPEPRLLTVQVWDNSMVKAVEKAIRESSLGLNPAIEGQLIRIILPELNQERRAELAKIASKYCEEAKISVRNVRRDGNEHIKKLEKDKEISEDDSHRLVESIQEITDKHIKKIDEITAHKQKDVMSV